MPLPPKFRRSYDTCNAVTPVQGYKACNGDMFVRLEEALASSIATNYNNSSTGYRFISRYEIMELVESNPNLILQLAEIILDNKR